MTDDLTLKLNESEVFSIFEILLEDEKYIKDHIYDFIGVGLKEALKSRINDSFVKNIIETKLSNRRYKDKFFVDKKVLDFNEHKITEIKINNDNVYVCFDNFSRFLKPFDMLKIVKWHKSRKEHYAVLIGFTDTSLTFRCFERLEEAKSYAEMYRELF
jgi:DNA replication protein DnaD